MSNAVKKIQENAEANEKLKRYTLYGSLIGSVIVTIGKLSGKTEPEMLDDFARFSKDEELYKCGNVKEVCDYIIKDFKMPEEYKPYIVFITDPSNLYTPLITCVDNEGYVQALDKNGNYMGVLSRPDFDMEYIYEEEEQSEGED